MDKLPPNSTDNFSEKLQQTKINQNLLQEKLSIENDVAYSLSYKDLITTFVSFKARKVNLIYF